MKRVLVTGASGFIGRHVPPLLRERGYEVHATTRNGNPVAGEVIWHQCDLLNPGDVAAVLRRVAPTHLLHLAWYAEHGKFWSSPSNLDWTAASIMLAKSFSGSGGTRAVMAGTCAEYEWNTRTYVERETPVKPATLYGVAKNALREIVERFSAGTPMSFAWGRVFFVFGPHEDPARLVPWVVRSLLRGEEALTSAGEQERDFLSSWDVASAFVALLDSEVEGPVNIASGNAVRVRDLVAKIGMLLQRPQLIKLGGRPMAENDPPSLVADVRRLRDEVRWSPPVDLDRPLAEVIDWWRREDV